MKLLSLFAIGCCYSDRGHLEVRARAPKVAKLWNVQVQKGGPSPGAMGQASLGLLERCVHGSFKTDKLPGWLSPRTSHTTFLLNKKIYKYKVHKYKLIQIIQKINLDNKDGNKIVVSRNTEAWKMEKIVN